MYQPHLINREYGGGDNVNIKNISVRWKIGCILILMFILAVVNVVGVLMFIQTQKDDGNVINVAGAQRMLSQKMTKEAFMIATMEMNNRNALEETATRFDRSLNALIDGNDDMRIPPAPDKVKEQLLIVKGLWDDFYPKIKIIESAPRDSEEFQSALTYIHDNNIKLLTEMNKAVKLYQEVFEEKISRLKAFLAGILVMNLLAIGVAWVLIGKSIIDPIASLKNAAKQIASGNLEQKISKPKFGDEIGELTVAMREMVAGIKRALREGEQKLVNGMGEPLRVIDREFNVIMQNQAMMNLTGVKEGQKIECYERKGAECETEMSTLNRVLQGEKMLTIELEKTTQDGRAIPTIVTVTPYKDAKGNVAGVIEFFKDISEVKAKEKEMLESKEYLESQVNRILPAVESIARGDLTHPELEIVKDDAINKIAAAVNEASKNLKRMMFRLKKAASKLASTSEELAASSQEMNATTTQISDTVQQIALGAQDTSSQVHKGSKEVKRLSDIITEVAESAGIAAEIAKKAEESAKEGGRSAEAAARKMKSILEVTEDTSGKVKELGSRSKEISNIVEVISSIAEQTNLLALNAAIEAARAGEHGKGFAVVAEEVRKLAEDSSKAAEKIGDLIKEIQAEIDMAVEGMERGTMEVSEGSEVVNNALEALSGIVASVSEATTRMLEITEAAQEQREISGEIVDIISQVASVAEEAASGAEGASAATEEQTASMEELAASAQELARLANDLQDIVNSFKMNGAKRGEVEAQLPASVP